VRTRGGRPAWRGRGGHSRRRRRSSPSGCRRTPRAQAWPCVPRGRPAWRGRGGHSRRRRGAGGLGLKRGRAYPRAGGPALGGAGTRRRLESPSGRVTSRPGIARTRCTRAVTAERGRVRRRASGRPAAADSRRPRRHRRHRRHRRRGLSDRRDGSSGWARRPQGRRSAYAPAGAHPPTCVSRLWSVTPSHTPPPAGNCRDLHPRPATPPPGGIPSGRVPQQRGRPAAAFRPPP
jgi:hypothetical protein